MYHQQKLTILKEDNYFKWSNEIQIFLGQKNLRRCIEYNQLEDIHSDVSDLQIMYELEKEDVMQNNVTLSDAEKKELLKKIDQEWKPYRIKWIEANEKKKSEWQEDQERCKAFIQGSISEVYLQNIKKCNTAREMWLQLKKEAQGSEIGNLLALKASFYKASMEKEETLTKFLVSQG